MHGIAAPEALLKLALGGIHVLALEQGEYQTLRCEHRHHHPRRPHPSNTGVQSTGYRLHVYHSSILLVVVMDTVDLGRVGDDVGNAIKTKTTHHTAETARVVALTTGS